MIPCDNQTTHANGISVWRKSHLTVLSQIGVHVRQMKAPDEEEEAEEEEEELGVAETYADYMPSKCEYTVQKQSQ